MRLLPRILGRIAFVRMEFTSVDGCRSDVYVWRRGGLEPGDWSAAKGCLAAVVVCGHGVVTKPDDAEITVRVRADDGEHPFLSQWRSEKKLAEVFGEYANCFIVGFLFGLGSSTFC